MARHTAVGIYDDLAPGQSAVTVRTADHKSSRRVDKEFGILVNHFCGNDLVKYIFFNILVDLLLGHIRVMLRGKYNCIQSFRSPILIILYCDLCLSVRAEIGEDAVLPDLCQAARQLMRHCDRIRHIFLSLIGRISEHHPLVACADCLNIIL